MQTRLDSAMLDRAKLQEADRILRSCVHCGFCTATCPTYQLFGDELDGPRGRIYQIKQLLEGESVSAATRLHLDRCLTCRSCETTCPSGVEYVRLLDLGRELMEQRAPRGLGQGLLRWMLRQLLPHPARFGWLLGLGQRLKPLLPGALGRKVPACQALRPEPMRAAQRRILLLDGCVQSVATPRTNNAARRLLARFGIELISPVQAGCCGALSQHLAKPLEARRYIRANIDAWWPYIEQGVEALLASASGCGVMLRDYARLMADEPAYAHKAIRVVELLRDPAELLRDEPIPPEWMRARLPAIAVHSPCTLQHGQQLSGVVEQILTGLGFELRPVADGHLCCGSGGAYSLLHPRISRQLRDQRLAALEAGEPELIVTANIGCQLHLGSGTATRVVHWLELIDDHLIEDRSSEASATAP